MKIRQLSKHLCGCRPRCTMKSLPVLNTAFRSSTPGFASLYRQVSNSPPLWDIWRPEPSMRICNLHGEFQKTPSICCCPRSLPGHLWWICHTLAAIDGKHNAIRKPPKSGTLYYNYKGFFSVILLAMVDHDYKFIWCDVGGKYQRLHY